MTAKPLNWSQRVTMRMIANGRSPAGGDSYLDTAGLGIPGGAIRSLRPARAHRAVLVGRAWLRLDRTAPKQKGHGDTGRLQSDNHRRPDRLT